MRQLGPPVPVNVLYQPDVDLIGKPANLVLFRSLYEGYRSNTRFAETSYDSIVLTKDTGVLPINGDQLKAEKN